MANQNLLTYGAKLSSVVSDYYGPVATIPYTSYPLQSTYCFVSQVDPWTNINNPPTPVQDQKSIKKIFKNIFALKRVLTSDIAPVIQRIDWTTGTTYDYYRDDINMFEVDQNGLLVLNFYVRNRYDQVFKCLWNNNGGVSTKEPFFEPGFYSTSNIYQSTDGYKWKYIYTLDTGQKIKFMDTSWMPITIKNNALNPLASTAGTGSIDVINVINGGSSYDSSNVITVDIDGDGTGASAVVDSSYIVNGSVADVIVTNPGSNYTYANISFSSANGSGLVALSNTVSPIGGHGYDPISELGCSHTMYAVSFNGSESVNGLAMVPTDVTYYQIGLIVNPVSLRTAPSPANSTIYKTSTDIIVASGSGNYSSGEIVYQTSANTDTDVTANSFTGTVLSWDNASGTIRVINTTGDITYNSTIVGASNNTTRTVLNSTPPEYIISSGYLAFVENRAGIQRSIDGIEQFKIVIGY